jgi:HSP20 family protein
MSITRFDPFGDPFRPFDRLTDQLLSGRRAPMGMPMDVWQAEDGYHVALDLPGVDPGSVDISCERNMLTISADRAAEYEQAQNVLVAERPHGSFTRRVQIGDGLDTENIQASYDNGVLRLTIPVAQAAQARRIEIQRGTGGQPTQLTAGQQSEQSESSDAETGDQPGASQG